MPDCSPCCPERLMLMEPSSDETLTTVRVRFFLTQSRSTLETLECGFVRLYPLFVMQKASGAHVRAGLTRQGASYGCTSAGARKALSSGRVQLY